MPNLKNWYLFILWENEGRFLQPISTLAASKRRKHLPQLEGVMSTSHNNQESKEEYIETAKIVSTCGYLKTTYYHKYESLHLKDRNWKPDEGSPTKYMSLLI